MANIVPMTHLDTGKTADVHPDEVENMKVHGWRESETKTPTSTPAPLPPPPSSVKPQLSMPKRKD